MTIVEDTYYNIKKCINLTPSITKMDVTLEDTGLNENGMATFLYKMRPID